MQLIKITDNGQFDKSGFASVPNLTSKIANKTLKQLETEGVFVFPDAVKDSDDLTRDQMILQGVNDKYLSSNVMGFIGCGDERLVIRSRFSQGDNDFFFQYLLQKVLDFPDIVDLSTGVSQENQLFNFLLFLFPYYLQSAMRKGLYKEYIRRSYNDANVKGTIDIARHIKSNTPFVGKIAYNQREFSYDNNLMQLVRHTIEFIKGKPYGSKLLRNVRDEIKLIVDATPGYDVSSRRKVIYENKNNIIRHAYYREYRALQHLCILILQHQKHQIGSGSRQIYGILVDGAWLWEEYIAQLIGDKFYHPMNKGGKGAQHLFNKNSAGLIYPDFISKDADNRIIADAKYKPIDNIGNKDYLQVLAYMFRFDAKTGYYLYPEKDEKEGGTLFLNQGTSYEKNVAARSDVSVKKLGFYIPKEEDDYKVFVGEMKEREEALKAAVV